VRENDCVTSDVETLFKALADEKRIKILAAAIDRELSIDDLMAVTGLPRRAVSQCVAYLQRIELLVSTESSGGPMYRFSRRPLIDALRTMHPRQEQSDFGDDLAEYDQKVLSTFMEDGRLKSIPAQARKREVILRFLAEQFEPARMYGEREVNEILRRYHEDVASLRRYMVDAGIISRQIVRVVRAEALLDGAPDIKHQLMYWKPGPDDPGAEDAEQ
jgi:DNA-binding transcriptional ArsR family regulator